MFARLAAYAPFGLRLLFGNLWLFAPLMKLVMPALSPQAGAMLRTTAAFTMLSGSDACNVLPQEASVWANLRFIPHQGMDESLALIRKRAGNTDWRRRSSPRATIPRPPTSTARRGGA